MGSKRRPREDPCHICGHYHDYENGQPCSICGHVLAPHDKRPGDTVIPANIIPGFLYLGSFDTASRSGLLKTMNITHILNTVPSCQELFKNTFIYHTVSSTPPSYDECYQFIEEVRKSPDTKILVHCMSGVSKSPAVVVAYLMKARNWRLAESYKWVKDKRPNVRITEEESKRLMELEQSLFGSCSAPLGLQALDSACGSLLLNPASTLQPLALPQQPGAAPFAVEPTPQAPVFTAAGGSGMQEPWRMSAQPFGGGLVFGAAGGGLAPDPQAQAQQQAGFNIGAPVFCFGSGGPAGRPTEAAAAATAAATESHMEM